jgi:flagellar hook assembly protein FlgD
VQGGGYAPPAQVLNFPNPFVPGRGTQFVVNGLTAASEVEVRVFTVDGRLIRSLRGAGGPPQAQVGWDGRDESGAEVANGVYLYRVSVFPTGGPVVELEGRAAAVR